MYFLYKWTNVTTGKAYIGATNNVARRWKRHLYDATRGSSLPFHRAIVKYGADCWKREVLESDLSITDASRLESQLILDHHTKVPDGYNLTDGGRGLQGHTFSEQHKQRLKWSPERKANVKRQYSLGNHPKKGKPSSLIGQARPDVVNRFSRHWIVWTPDHQILNITNLKAFCRERGLNPGHMSSVATGHLASHKGYVCKEELPCY